MGKAFWGLLLGLASWEGSWWLYRRGRRLNLYTMAWLTARQLGRPLVVVGAPDGGVTAGYPCGDVTIDILPSDCPAFLEADVTRPLPFANDSVVVFVSCTLEYVHDYAAAMAELRRIAGRWLFVVRVEPWTLTAYLYPGTRRQLPEPSNPLVEPL